MSKLYGAFPAALGSLDTPGGIAAIKNPEGEDLYVTRLLVDITTKATAACTIDAGIAANATTSADNLIDGADAFAATGTLDNQRNAGTNGRAGFRWPAGQFLTVSRATGAAAGLKGNVLIEYIRLT